MKNELSFLFLPQINLFLKALLFVVFSPDAFLMRFHYGIVVLLRVIDFALLMMRRLCVWKGRSIGFFQEKCVSSHIVFIRKHTVIDFDMQNRMLQK